MYASSGMCCVTSRATTAEDLQGEGQVAIMEEGGTDVTHSGAVFHSAELEKRLDALQQKIDTIGHTVLFELKRCGAIR